MSTCPDERSAVSHLKGHKGQKNICTSVTFTLKCESLHRLCWAADRAQLSHSPQRKAQGWLVATEQPRPPDPGGVCGTHGGVPPAPGSSVTGTKVTLSFYLFGQKCICSPARARRAGWEGWLACGLHPERFGLGARGVAPGANRCPFQEGLSSCREPPPPRHQHIMIEGQRLASVLAMSGVGSKLRPWRARQAAAAKDQARGPSEQSNFHTTLARPPAAPSGLRCPGDPGAPNQERKPRSTPRRSPPPNRESGEAGRDPGCRPLGWRSLVSKEEF